MLRARFLFGLSSALKMEATVFLKRQLTFNRTTWTYIPQYRTLHTQVLYTIFRLCGRQILIQFSQTLLFLRYDMTEISETSLKLQVCLYFPLNSNLSSCLKMKMSILLHMSGLNCLKHNLYFTSELPTLVTALHIIQSTYCPLGRKLINSSICSGFHVFAFWLQV
jgi:hypothetical protein